MKTGSKSVSMIMTTDPIRASAGDSARELAELLDVNQVSGVPVVDTQDRVIGVVSRTDLLHQCVQGPLGESSEAFLEALASGTATTWQADDLGTVGDFMSTTPVLASPDDPVDGIARRMVEERVHRVIIVDESRRCIGIVTTLDLIKALSG
jgi:CBS domain-containing protein